VRYEIVTFDCYGTLVDWDRGIRDAFARAAEADGVAADADALRLAYDAIEPVVESEPYRRYREVLAETATRAAAGAGWTMGGRTAEAFAASLVEWRPFPDTNLALERLRAAGMRLGLLSNVDRDLLAGTLGHFTVEFDVVVTAEDVRSYKPGHAHFLEGRHRIRGARWLHAAQSYRHDVVPASELQIPCAWVNRNGDVPSGEARAVREVETLAELADWLVATGSGRG
jgi:2-haloalkanoic acid dehalogenase type II